MHLPLDNLANKFKRQINSSLDKLTVVDKSVLQKNLKAK